MTPPHSRDSTIQHITDDFGYPLGRYSRVLLVLWSLFLMTGFALAAWLEPNPRGFGTHQQLGLPPCTFRFLFDIPCPSCGMTTSFSFFVRGQLISAAKANVGGLLLAIICLIQIPWCLFSVYLGRLWRLSRPEVGLMWTLVSVCGASVLNWLARLLMG